MASYYPPEENVPTFDAGLFVSSANSNSSSINIPLLETLFLTYPMTQGTPTLTDVTVTGLAEFNDTATFNRTDHVVNTPSHFNDTLNATSISASGVASFSSTAIFNGADHVVNTPSHFNNTINVTIISASGSIRANTSYVFPDATTQSTAFLPITPSSYTNSNVIVNFQEAITSRSNGSGGTGSSGGQATTLDVSQNNNNLAYYPLFSGSAATNQTICADTTCTPLSYNPYLPTLTCSNLSGTAPLAQSVSGGISGSLPYQSGTNATSMLGIGPLGTVLGSNGSLPYWCHWLGWKCRAAIVRLPVQLVQLEMRELLVQ